MVELDAKVALKSLDLPVDLVAPLFGCPAEILQLLFQFGLLFPGFFMERRYFLGAFFLALLRSLLKPEYLIF